MHPCVSVCVCRNCVYTSDYSIYCYIIRSFVTHFFGVYQLFPPKFTTFFFLLPFRLWAQFLALLPFHFHTILNVSLSTLLTLSLSYSNSHSHTSFGSSIVIFIVQLRIRLGIFMPHITAWLNPCNIFLVPSAKILRLIGSKIEEDKVNVARRKDDV